MSQILIGSRPVGLGQDPFIVAEVGINHNGDINRALEMINVASKAGCDAVKFQTFKADEFINDPAQIFTYQSQGQQVSESMLKMFKRYELPDSAWPILKEECRKTNIIFFSTPQNITDLDTLMKVGVPAIKVGSDDFTNIPLLVSYSKTGLPIILSTGMSDLSESYQALESIGALDGYPAILLVCTSQYPTSPNDANLARISTLRSAFPMVPIGFSDHTSGFLASSIAVSLGACFLEKHFTLSHDLPGPDHWFSEDPDGLRDWVSSIRTAHIMMGSPLVRPTLQERQNKLEFQRVIVAAKDIERGEIFTEENLSMRRVAGGLGFSPNQYYRLLGKIAWRNFKKFTAIDF